MKNIFGIFSLIAILTVTFTLQANTSQDDIKRGVVFDVGEHVSVAVAVVDTAEFEPVFVSRKNGDFYSNPGSSINLDKFVDLRIDPGSSIESSNDIKEISDTNSLKSQSTRGSSNEAYKGLHEPVGWNF